MFIDQKLFGIYYKYQKDHDSAREYFERSIKGYKSIKIFLDLPEYIFEYADMEEELGDITKSKKFYQESLKYAKKMKDKKWIGKAGKKLAAIEK